MGALNHRLRIVCGSQNCRNNRHVVIAGPCRSTIFSFKDVRMVTHDVSSSCDDLPAALVEHLLVVDDHRSSSPLRLGFLDRNPHALPPFLSSTLKRKYGPEITRHQTFGTVGARFPCQSVSISELRTVYRYSRDKCEERVISGPYFCSGANAAEQMQRSCTAVFLPSSSVPTPVGVLVPRRSPRWLSTVLRGCEERTERWGLP